MSVVDDASDWMVEIILIGGNKDGKMLFHDDLLCHVLVMTNARENACSIPRKYLNHK